VRASHSKLKVVRLNDFDPASAERASDWLCRGAVVAPINKPSAEVKVGCFDGHEEPISSNKAFDQVYEMRLTAWADYDFCNQTWEGTPHIKAFPVSTSGQLLVAEMHAVSIQTPRVEAVQGNDANLLF
jgi:hypothetical protein